MEWISVKDKLPDDDEAVLMCHEEQDGLPLMGWYYSEDYAPGFYMASTFQDFRVLVTHWMPLPKLPNA